MRDVFGVHLVARKVWIKTHHYKRNGFVGPLHKHYLNVMVFVALGLETLQTYCVFDVLSDNVVNVVFLFGGGGWKRC